VDNVLARVVYFVAKKALVEKFFQYQKGEENSNEKGKIYVNKEE